MPLSLPVIAFLTAAVYLIWKTFLRDLIAPSAFNFKNLPGPESPSWLGGHLEALFNRQGWKYWKHLAETYGTTFLVSGPMGEKIMIVHDPKALHSILIKDVENYPKRTHPSDEFMVFLGPGLLTTDGQQHRHQRRMLNPVFSAAHLRHMSDLFHEITDKMRAGIEKRVTKEGWQVIDINGWMARTTLEMLGQAGLGYSFDNFIEDSSDAYGESLKNFFPVMARLSSVGYIVRELSRIFPDNVIRAILRRVPHANTRLMMEISDTLMRRSKEIIDEKKAALSKGDEALVHQVGEGKDIMSILLRANMAATEAEKLPDEELIAQMSILMLAGMDTTSNALSRILQLLASHPEVQAKLRAEVLEARNGEPAIDYENIMKLTYLDAVCRETLRLHSPVHLVGRRAGKNTVLPLLHPVRGKDGREMREVAVPRNTLLLLNFQGSNYDTQLWGEDAQEWKPERWLKPTPAALEEARMPGVYSNIMSFSGGTRSCIGFKFSQLEMKVVLSVLLASFEFELTDREITWNLGAVSYPTMGLESEKPEMVLKVRAL